MNPLVHYFKDKITVSDDLAEKLNDLSVEKNYDKGEIVQEQHSLKKEHFFVVEGCLRSFFVDKNGKEHTIQFAIKNWWMGDYITLYTNNTSVLSIDSLTHSKIVSIDKKEVEKIYKTHPEFEIFQRKNFEKHLASLQKRILNLLTLTALEKYESFLENYSEFSSYIPNYQIASYLGITPESLSRIRKERAKNKQEQTS